MYRILSFALVALLTPLSAEITFAPKPDTRLEKTWVVRADLHERIAVVGATEAEPPFDVRGTVARDVVMKDTYRELMDGRPRVLGRTLAKAAGMIETVLEVDIDGETTTMRFDKQLASERQGLPLVLTWDEALKAHVATLENAGEGGGALATEFGGMREETDLRSFLPKEAVEPGARWKAPASALADVFSAGGDLAFRFKSEGHATHDDFKLFGAELGEMLMSLESQVDVQYVSRDEDRANIVRLVVTFVVSGVETLSGPLHRRARERSTRERAFTNVPESFELAGEGTIEWDTARGLPHRARFEGRLDATWRVELHAGEKSAVDRRTMDGTIVATLATQGS